MGGEASASVRLVEAYAAAQIIEHILIDHAAGHLNNIQATAGARSVGA